MDHLENKSFEEPRWQYAGDGVGSCPLQSLPVRLTTEGPSGAAVSRVNCVAVVSYFPHTDIYSLLFLKDQESPSFPFLSKLICLFSHVLNLC